MTMPPEKGRPIVNRLDLERLDQILGSPEHGPATVEYVRWLLEHARAVEPHEVPRDVVTMHSRVRLRSVSGEEEELVLCYPGEEDALQGGLSVLSPLGAALLGLKEGATVRVIGPRPRTFVVGGIIHQPERAISFST